MTTSKVYGISMENIFAGGKKDTEERQSLYSRNKYSIVR